MEIHEPMKNEIEETCQLRKMMQVSMMSVFLWIMGYLNYKERKVCVYQSMFILHLIMLCPPWSMLSMIQLWWWYNAKLVVLFDWSVYFRAAISTLYLQNCG